ncbi:hypothetical protein I7I53_06862 [Histoplasma capsulatum var. duboisii H88]|uniref:Uncharacterized protein n=1 Tax=Ajellomyces capsulatus (strain H88) TaxID=544711 RepID=A0A8A1LI98_AJEC8|nr:hypothetical protein I7I53_06862 [Histoplasma capsulatum var. duboisii H88]
MVGPVEMQPGEYCCEKIFEQIEKKRRKKKRLLFSDQWHGHLRRSAVRQAAPFQPFQTLSPPDPATSSGTGVRCAWLAAPHPR